MLFISNRKRLDLIKAASNQPELVVATSNLSGILPDSINYVNYSSYIGEGRAADNAGTMLIRILKSIGVFKIALAGLDGFDVDAASNYSITAYRYGLERAEADAKNQNIGRQLRLALSGMEYQFITPKKYEV